MVRSRASYAYGSCGSAYATFVSPLLVFFLYLACYTPKSRALNVGKRASGRPRRPGVELWKAVEYGDWRPPLHVPGAVETRGAQLRRRCDVCWTGPSQRARTASS